MCCVKEIGEGQSSLFAKEWIKMHKVKFWALMKKLKLKTCSTSCRKASTKQKEKHIGLRADLSLFSRLLVASRSRSDVDFKGYLSQYEFSVLPSSLFVPDGNMHHCYAKSKLLEILTALPKQNLAKENEMDIVDLSTSAESTDATGKVAIIDTMAELHCLVKPSSVKTCGQFGAFFSNMMDNKFRTYDELHLVSTHTK